MLIESLHALFFLVNIWKRKMAGSTLTVYSQDENKHI